MEKSTKSRGSFGGAYLVAAGMLLSRVAGLVRMRALAHFLGDSEAGDAFYAAIKIPNFPQNLLGEGVLSASFIPIYANLLAKGDQEMARKVASTVLSVLALVVSVVVLMGMAATPLMIDLIAPGFHGEKRELTIRLVQIIFPATGLLVISAWCLGILNSHHKFFLSYAAPVFSNLMVVLVLFFCRHEPLQSKLAMYAGFGLVLGAAAQLLVQVPTTLSLVPRLRPMLATKLPEVMEVLKNFLPVVVSRGVVQLSAYIDSILASFLPSGAVAALGYAQSIYMLPIGLFGMSVSAAELPSMSREFGAKDFALTIQRRINAACRRIAFFVVPSVVGFLLLGDVIAGLLFQSGQFNGETSRYVWTVLGGSAVGLLASTLGRLYSSAFYSLRDTRTPLRFSIIRVILTTALGWMMGLKLPALLHLDASWGTAGLTASAGISGWVEFLLLRRSLNQRVGPSGLETKFVVKLWVASLSAGAAAYGLKLAFAGHHPFLRGIAVLGVFGIVYFPVGILLGIEEARQTMRRVIR